VEANFFNSDLEVAACMVQPTEVQIIPLRHYNTASHSFPLEADSIIGSYMYNRSTTPLEIGASLFSLEGSPHPPDIMTCQKEPTLYAEPNYIQTSHLDVFNSYHISEQSKQMAETLTDLSDVFSLESNHFQQTNAIILLIPSATDTKLIKQRQRQLGAAKETRIVKRRKELLLNTEDFMAMLPPHTET
jgi:hypothetical protein